MGAKTDILQKGELVDNKYKIAFFLKKGSYAETYRVKDSEGNTRLLKLFIYSQLDRTQFTDNGKPLEVDVLKSVQHPNVVNYHDSGELIIENQKYGYVILDFISGETLADKMKREETLNQYEAKEIILGVLNGLNHLHSKDRALIHNDITNLNVMIDLSGKVPVPKIIDFGYARWIDQAANDFLKEGLNPFYQANEAFNRVFSAQSDIFSVGCLYYHLLFGMPPWFAELSRYKSDRIKIEDVILEERKKKLSFPGKDSIIDEVTLKIISKALQPKTENRFKSAKEFIKALNGELEIQLSESNEPAATVKPKKVKQGKGFSAIAGMQDLKDLIKLDVIDALNEKEKYAEYGLTIPNGMMLYGPPGCGKTFFAEKMAEEIGFNFYQIKPSDIQSKWVNASQENIKKLFDEARENAPSVIFIDELDAMVPNRDGSGINHMNTSAVNEFLAQMNNVGEDGVFIIGATNRPNSIDPAILRAGRLDKHIYLPPPDHEARKLMFELYLKKRPREVGLNFSELASATKNYVSSDIKFLCDEASRGALKAKSRITQEILSATIRDNKPSISLKELKNYETVKMRMEGQDLTSSERPRIGFKRD
jgi:transitional endoplasmic reticulum ATPase